MRGTLFWPGVWVLVLPWILNGQATGVIVGVVQDASGAGVPGANVRTVSELTGLEWTTTSAQTGHFSFPRLPVGEYRVEVT
ncbi:MAG: carboxypeptidase regulatory-like domain-containing protein, partial [Bryobacterales bacterium]|nr:carboxypeptidase regulatory-like domain-containing protein [Bryobacterales bacterium]